MRASNTELHILISYYRLEGVLDGLAPAGPCMRVGLHVPVPVRYRGSAPHPTPLSYALGENVGCHPHFAQGVTWSPPPRVSDNCRGFGIIIPTLHEHQ